MNQQPGQQPGGGQQQYQTAQNYGSNISGGLGVALKLVQRKPDIADNSLPARMFLIERVTPGSPAEMSRSLQPNDCLTRVDNTDLEDKDLPTVQNLLHGPPGSFVTLHCVRIQQGHVEPVSVTLPRPQAPQEDSGPLRAEIERLKQELDAANHNATGLRTRLAQTEEQIPPLQEGNQTKEVTIRNLTEQLNARGGVDPAMLQEMERLRQENESLRKNQADFLEMERLRRENNQLKSQVEELSSWLDNQQWEFQKGNRDNSGDLAALRKQIDAKQTIIDDLQMKLRAAVDRVRHLEASQRPDAEFALRAEIDKLRLENESLRESLARATQTDPNIGGLRHENENLRTELEKTGALLNTSQIQLRNSEDEMASLRRQIGALKEQQHQQSDNTHMDRYDGLYDELLQTRQQLEKENSKVEALNQELDSVRRQQSTQSKQLDNLRNTHDVFTRPAPGPSSGQPTVLSQPTTRPMMAVGPSMSMSRMSPYSGQYQY